MDEGNPWELELRCRLRLNMYVAQILRDQLTRLIDDANKPPDISKAN